jgi:acyl-CoA thioester hydrolase
MTDGVIAAGEHRLPIRVYYEDTDALGMVYYANYLRFAERARTEMMRSLWPDYGALCARFELAFVVRRCMVDYLAPARLDDRLEVRTGLVRTGGASLDLEQRVFCGDRLLARMEVRLALVSSALRALRLPPALIDALTPLRRDAVRARTIPVRA